MPKLMERTELITLIKETAGAQVAEFVREAMQRELAPLAQQQTDFMGRLLTGLQSRESPPVVIAEDKGLSFARCLRATAASKMAGNGAAGAIEILRQWGSHDLAEKWAEARQKALAAGDATAGGFLVPPQYSQEVIEFLRARAVIRRLGARVLPMPTGTVKIPKLSGGATAYYLGENTNATTSQPTTAQLTLSFKKLITMVPVSNDLLRYSSPGADSIVRDDTVNAMRVREDSAFIRDTGSDQAPKGLRHWAHADNILEATATVSVQNTFTDLGLLLQKLLDANIPMISPAWIMAPRTEQFLMTLINSQGNPVFRPELIMGRLWGFPYGVTTGVPTNVGTGSNKSEIYLADMAQVIIGEAMNLIVDASPDAAYHDGTTVQAAYSLDQTIVRAIAEHDLGLRHDKAVAVLTQVSWKPGSV